MTTTSNMYLSPEQRSLLLAALNSNSPATNQMQLQNGNNSHQRSMSNDNLMQSPNNLFKEYNDSIDFTSPNLFDTTGMSELNYNDMGLDGSFKYDLDDDESPSADHDKRKHDSEEDDDEDDDQESDPKRREGDDKLSKKPGRKPLTNEPTTKRKAQNRAAQRAFRERKEKHLKDLETKVVELEKKSETTDHENKLLRNQVDTLQAEVKQYRKRLSIEGSGLTQSPSDSMSSSTMNKRMSGGDGHGGFSFDFPIFGQVGQHIFNNGSMSKHSPETKMRTNSQPAPVVSYSPETLAERGKTNSNGSNGSFSSPQQQARKNSNNNNLGQLPRTNSAGSVVSNNNSMYSPNNHVFGDNTLLGMNKMTDFSSLFSPSIIEAANKDNSGDYMSLGASSVNTTPLVTSMLDFSTSPSASSVSQNSSRAGANGGFESSCDTSPEPMSSNSPLVFKSEQSFGQLNAIAEEGENKGIKNELSFCEQLSRACGTLSNPIPKAASELKIGPSFSWLADQNGGSFDPVLFDDYRDPVTQINDSIDMSFFEDAFPASTLDFNLGDISDLNPNTIKKPLVPELNDDDDDEVVPAEDPQTMLSCNTIWDRISKDPKLSRDEIDMDGLCSELRQKAKCSETGVVIAQSDVDKILKKVATGKRDSL